jgi:hypothetical protein
MRKEVNKMRGAGIAHHLIKYLSCDSEAETEACLDCPLNASLLEYEEHPSICDAFVAIDEAGVLIIDQQEGGE